MPSKNILPRLDYLISFELALKLKIIEENNILKQTYNIILNLMKI